MEIISFAVIAGIVLVCGRLLLQATAGPKRRNRAYAKHTSADFPEVPMAISAPAEISAEPASAPQETPQPVVDCGALVDCDPGPATR